MLDDSLLREFFTILLFASGPFSDAFVFGLQFFGPGPDRWVASVEFLFRKHATSWSPCSHVGLDESALLQAQAIGNWRERAKDKFFWMNQFDDFFRSMTNDEREM